MDALALHRPGNHLGHPQHEGTKVVPTPRHNVARCRPSRSGDGKYVDALHDVWGVMERLQRPSRSREDEMIGPAKNRLHDYEAGWLTLLIKMGVASEQEAQAAMNRVAQAAIDEQESRQGRRKREGRRRKPPE